jgi:NADPH:quinone reductase-like Zn-dependent oxidoreductase
LSFPATLGGDLAGVVADVGEGVKEFKVGDAVYGSANSVSGQGAFAEFAPAKVTSLAPKPESLDFVQAAALPLVGVSAYIGIVELLQVQKGNRVLIHGGAGGIGSVAVQLAKYLGAYVASTAAGEDADFVKALGADVVIDYETEDFAKILQKYDAVFDTVGGETAIKSYQILRPGGRLASMLEQPHEDLMQQYEVTALYESSNVGGERLGKLAELVEGGAIKVNVDKVFPLGQVADAMAYLEAGHHRGKVVIRVKD